MRIRTALPVLAFMLLAADAQATNMSFKLDLEIPVQDPFSGSQNFFFLAYPLWNGLPDVGTEAPVMAGQTHCASQPGEFVPDGVITLADVICDTWTMLPELTGSNLASVQYIDPSDCSWVALAMNISPFFGATFGGALGVEVATIRETGLLLQLTQSTPGMNRPVIVGSHDPGHVGHELPDPMLCAQSIISPYYHSLYASTTEIFCGLEGVDWVDSDLDGVPDTCNGGIWDGVNLFALQAYSNTPGNTGFRAATIREFRAVILLPSAPIPLHPGHALLLSMETRATPNRFIQPHY